MMGLAARPFHPLRPSQSLPVVMAGFDHPEPDISAPPRLRVKPVAFDFAQAERSLGIIATHTNIRSA
ncbi:hypothetical protein ABIC44_002605 [Sphingomonas sp. 1185]